MDIVVSYSLLTYKLHKHSFRHAQTSTAALMQSLSVSSFIYWLIHACALEIILGISNLEY
jgi:hypothetical protein